MKQDYCNKCGACCKNIPVDFSHNVIFRDGIQELTSEFKTMLIPISKTNNITFCSCKYLVNNLCTHSKKPEECKIYPSSPFAFLPEECGYRGDIFIKLESIKQKIRKLKEEIIHYETLDKTQELQKLINHHKNIINKYKQYGSEDW